MSQFYSRIPRKTIDEQFREKRPWLGPGQYLDRLFSEIGRIAGQNLTTVLDFGGDTGATLSLLASRLTIHRPVCYDLVAPAQPIPGVEYVHGSWEDLTRAVPEGSVDLVLAEEVIEHIFDPDAMVERCKRILRPRGVLVLTTPNLSSAINRIALMLGRQPGGTEVSTRAQFTGKGRLPGPVAGHIRVFTFGALLEFLEYHGLSVLDAYTVAWPPALGPVGSNPKKRRRTLNQLIETVAARVGRTLASRSVVIARVGVP